MQKSESSSAWYCFVAGRQYGPLDRATLEQYVREGRVTGETPVWCEGMADWRPAAGVKELRKAVGESPAASADSRAVRLVFGLHDPSVHSYHQGRLLGSVDALIFGIGSLVPFLGLLLAIGCIGVASKAISAGRRDPDRRTSGYGLAIAALALGVFSVVAHAMIGMVMVLLYVLD